MPHREHSALARDWTYLERAVETSRSVWNDTARRQFEEKYWRSLCQIVSSHLEALGELAQAVEHVKRNMP